MLRLPVIIVFALIAFFQTATGVAHAALPEFTPSSEGFTATGGAAHFAGALTVNCKSSEIFFGGGGAITSAKTVRAPFTFKTCETLGVKVHSAGASAGEILVKSTGELCYISEIGKQAGLLLTIAETTIEGVGVKSVLKGSIIAQVTPVNLKQTTGSLELIKPNITSCGGKGAQLLSNVNGGAFKATEAEAVLSVSYEKATEVRV